MSSALLRCVVCRTRRATPQGLFAHQATSGHRAPCGCGGYHFPHRPGGGCCERGAYFRTAQARRAGATEGEVLDAWIDDVWENDFSRMQRSEEAPF